MAFGIDHLRREIEQRFNAVDAQFASMTRALLRLEGKLDTMPTDQDLNNALDGFSQAVQQGITDAQTRTQADIDALKAQIANGQPVTQADLDKIAQTQQTTLAGLANIDPANPTPPSP